MTSKIRNIDLFYDHTNSQESALRLILALRPEWESSKGTIEFVRFKDGITNTLFKAINRLPGLTERGIDREAILLRAYGRGTQVLIDRDREAASHSLLASHKLAPSLLARFNNGLLYEFIPGRVTSPEDLRRPEIYKAVARRIAEWHATLMVSDVTQEPESQANGRPRRPSIDDRSEKLTPHMPVPNIWTVMQKWIYALPVDTTEKKQRQAQLQTELEWMLKELGDTPGIAGYPLVFGHCDLLSGNVIVLPSSGGSSDSSNSSSPALSATTEEPTTTVSFIDYEYATPSPAAFDIANHFAEWGGFECDFAVLPARDQRREFLQAYLQSFNELLGREYSDTELKQLFDEVDAFRGAPGFYWGIWALIQATISQIDFNYADYAEIRLGEYFAWKDARQGKKIREPPLRERRWAQED